MPKAVPIRKCPKCRGKGTVPLSLPLADTYSKLLHYVVGVTASDLARDLKVNVTAINNRLERLRAAKLVTRRRTGHPQGRQILYFTIPPR